MNIDPAYDAIDGYYNEWQDSENGCSLTTIVGDGAEAIGGVAGTVGIAAGGAGYIGSRLGSAAEAGAAAERTTAVIGRQADTAVAKDWAGHEVLDLPAKEWSIARNDQWVQSVIDRKMPVYVGSPTTWPNLWDAAAGRSTVFGRELQQFTKAGYTWDGWTMIPPGG